MRHNPNTLCPLAGLDPRDISVIIVAHGDQGRASTDPDATRNQALERHRARLASTHAFRHVTAGVLKGSPTFEDALGAACKAKPKAVALYPFFMSDGYFFKKILPQRLADYGLTLPHQYLQPLGLEAGLVNVIAAQALECASNAQIEAKQARLLLTGHGSKFGRASANATHAAVQYLKTVHANTFAEIDIAFLEEAPFLGNQLADTKRTTIVSGFFNGDGLHAREDVPAALNYAATSGGCQAVYAGPVGSAPEVSDLIQSEILAAISPQ